MQFVGGARNRAERREAARRRRGSGRWRRGRPDRLATSGTRIAAALVDSVLTGLLMSVVALVASIVANLPSDRATFAVYVVPGAIAGHAYTLVLTALSGQTVGKALLGIRVVRVDTFDVPGWRRAAIRTLGLVPLGVLPYGSVVGTAGEASFLVTRSRQGVHDVLAGTIVVDDREWRRWRERSGRRRPPPSQRTR